MGKQKKKHKTLSLPYRKYLNEWQVLEIEKVKCPFCGKEQKVHYAPDAKCRGVFVRCSGRHCKQIFEIKLNQDK